MLKILVGVLVLVHFSLIRAHFDFKLGYCSIKCEDPCDESEDKAVETNIPGAFYWRDFYGKIPKDAFPLGNSNQYPQTYIGMVYEPLKNGTFVVTIVDGLNYVYAVQDGEVFKRTDHIQILCTSEPERLTWIRLTATNIQTLKGFKTVRGSHHVTHGADNRLIVHSHYITRATTCEVAYAGYNSAIGGTMEYALLDGTPANKTNVLWLIFNDDKKKNKERKSEMTKGQSFFSHLYEYKIRPDSIIPSFYKQINVGTCSITCTNEGNDKRNKFEKDSRILASMAYYWKPNNVFERKEIMIIGEDNVGNLSVAQTYISSLNLYSIEEISLDNSRTVVEPIMGSTVEDINYYQILSTKQPELFEWINATTETFPQLDKSRMIPAGQMANGTDIFVGRQVDDRTSSPGGIRLLDTGAYCHTTYGFYKDFQVLMFKDPNGSKGN